MAFLMAVNKIDVLSAIYILLLSLVLFSSSVYGFELDGFNSS